jgi:hypothetical protein
MDYKVDLIKLVHAEVSGSLCHPLHSFYINTPWVCLHVSLVETKTVMFQRMI